MGEVDMSDQTEFSDDPTVRTLEAEVRALQQRLGQREELLKVLNRRLLQLERGENGDTQALRDENSCLHEQLGLCCGARSFPLVVSCPGRLLQIAASEVSPAASRYTAEPNLRYANDSHVMAIGRVPANSRVLDLGVADGSVAAVLKGMGCQVWGVELEQEAAEAARAVCDEVVVADLNTFEFAEQLEGRRFDVVLMLDILEHLSDPAAVLGRVKAVVAERGWGIISLPNVAHASVRLALLKGRFRYTEMGLLDRTHLRFFDRAGVDDLLEQAGWGMFDMVRVTRRLGTTEIPVDDADPVLAADLESDIEGTTYQFVVGAAPLGSPVLEHPPVLPAAVAQGVLLEQEEELRQLRLANIPDLTEQLTAIRAGVLERRSQLQGLLDALDANRERFGGVSG